MARLSDALNAFEKGYINDQELAEISFQEGAISEDEYKSKVKPSPESVSRETKGLGASTGFTAAPKAQPGEETALESLARGAYSQVLRKSKAALGGVVSNVEGGASFVQKTGSALKSRGAESLGFRDIVVGHGLETVGASIAKKAEEVNKQLIPQDPTLADQIAMAAGSTVPFYLAGFGVMAGARRLAQVSTSLAKWTGTSVPAVMEAMINSGQVYKESLINSKRNNVDPEQAEKEAQLAANKTFALNIPINAISSYYGIYADKGKALQKVFMSSLGEGGQEGFQELIGNFALHDPDLLRNVPISALVGSIVGGGAKAVSIPFESNEPSAIDVMVQSGLPEDVALESVRQKLGESLVALENRPVNLEEIEQVEEDLRPASEESTVVQPLAEEVKPPVGETTRADAIYIGDMKDPDTNAPIPLYNITKEGHPRKDSTVTKGTLEELGLKVPEITTPGETKVPQVTQDQGPVESKESPEKFEPESLPESDIQEMAAKSWQVDLTKEPTTEAKTSRLKIIEFVEKEFMVPVRGKSLSRMPKAAGHFEIHPELIRLKKWGEPEVLAHEAGHRLENLMGPGWLGKFISSLPNRSEVLTEVKNMDYDKVRRDKGEGFAEYLRHFVTTKQESKNFPKFDAAFKQYMEKNPDLKRKIEEFRNIYQEYSEMGSVNRVLSQIDFKGEIKRTTSITNKIKSAHEKLISDWWDELYPLEKTEKELGIESRKKVRPTQSAFEMATYVKSTSRAIARTFALKSAVDEWGNPVGPSLSKILEPIKLEEMQTFIAYAVARRSQVLAKRGIESGIDSGDVNFLLDKYKNPTWDKVSDQITQWSDHGINWLVRSGALSAKSAQLIRDLNPVYLPLKRVFIDEAEKSFGNRQMMTSPEAIKKIKGSARPIINPMESLIENMANMLNVAHKTRVANLISDWTQVKGSGRYIVKVPPPMKAKNITPREIEEILEKIGLDKSQIPDDAQLDEILTLFSQSQRYTGKENIVSIWKGGKRVFYELDPKLYQALQGIDPLRLSGIAKLMAPFARLTRLGATQLKASFGLIRNPFRDALTYVAYSKRSNATIFDPLNGMYKDIFSKEGDPAFRFQSVGGDISSQMGYDREAVMAVYDQLLLEKHWAGKALKVVKHPIDAMRALLQIPEMGPRIAELEANYKKYLKENPSWTEQDAWVAAVNDAKDITINFSRSGRLGKTVNQVVAFFNVGMQGLSKLGRVAKDDPLGLTFKSLAWITLMSVGAWWRNKDKQWYKNLDSAYKYNNIFFEINEDTIIRLPIPFEIGVIFSSLPVAIFESLDKEDPKYMEGVGRQINTMLPPVEPSMFGPLIDVFRNKDYLGRPIESVGMQFQPITERKRDNTTKIASGLSNAVNSVGIELSPVQLDYLIYNYTGGLPGQFRFITEGVKDKTDIPILSDILVRAPSKPTRQLNEFFTELSDLRKKDAVDKISDDELDRLDDLEVIYKEVWKVHRQDWEDALEDNNLKEIDRLYKELQEDMEDEGFK